MKIVYFGFDLFADCFERLTQMAGVEIMAVHTYETDNIFEFNSKIKAIAKKNNIPIFFERITKERLEDYFDRGCDLTVSAGYIYKIPILSRPDFKGINIHPSLLPIGRGPWPYPVSILKGLKKTGVTIHKIAEGFDEGDILLKRAFPIDKEETLDTLTLKSQIVAKELIAECICNFSRLWENAEPQIGGEYWQEPTDSERTVTEALTVSSAQRIVRAFGSYGVIYNGRVYSGGEREKLVPLIDGTLTLKY